MPTLLDLPRESLLSIFLDSQLDYKDLKRISRVCKGLHKVEQDSELDLKMFRKGLPDYSRAVDKVVLAKKGKEVSHHPIFDYIDLTSDSIRNIAPSLSTIFDFVDRGHSFVPPLKKKIINLDCMNEYATSPPSRRITFEIFWKVDNIEIENDNGVTVKEVLVEVFDMWDSEPPEDFKETFMESLKKEVEQDESDIDRLALLELLDVVPLTWRMTIPSMTAIDRLAKPQVVEDDCVHLSAEWGSGQI